MSLRTSTLLAFSLVMGMAAVSHAQITGNPLNPTTGIFDHDDYTITTNYDVGYYFPGATAPLQTVSVPKTSVVSSPADGPVAYRFSLPRPILGDFVIKVRACGVRAGSNPAETVCSNWSNASPQFALVPLTPANPR